MFVQKTCSNRTSSVLILSTLLFKYIFFFLAVPHSMPNFPNQGSNPCPQSNFFVWSPKFPKVFLSVSHINIRADFVLGFTWVTISLPLHSFTKHFTSIYSKGIIYWFYDLGRTCPRTKSQPYNLESFQFYFQNVGTFERLGENQKIWKLLVNFLSYQKCYLEDTAWQESWSCICTSWNEGFMNMKTKYTFCNENNFHLSLVGSLFYFLLWELLLFSSHLTIFQPPKDKVLHTYIIFLPYSLFYCFIIIGESSKQQIFIEYLLTDRHWPRYGVIRINGDEPLHLIWKYLCPT